MTSVPNAARALLDPRKITAYLLSETHGDGKHKCEFFKRFGFAPDDPILRNPEAVEAIAIRAFARGKAAAPAQLKRLGISAHGTVRSPASGPERPGKKHRAGAATRPDPLRGAA